MPDLPWLVYAIPLAMVGVIGLAVVYKWLQVRQASDWPSAAGKVVVSGSQVRSVEVFDDDSDGGKHQEERNFANIVYEYTVSGQKLRNNRVSIGEDRGNFEVAETIARYPVGKEVTVYYNPRKPREAVLERELPKGMFGCVVWFLVIAVIGILFAFFGFNQLTIYLKNHVQNAPMVVALSAMGLVALLGGLSIHLQAAAVRRWPVVTGRITRSEVEAYEGRFDGEAPLATLYRSPISYTYEYKGVTYTGSQLSLGAKPAYRNEGVARRLVAKYPLGKTFKVYVNPQNPSEALLAPNSVGGWIVWAIAIALLAGAYFVSTQP